MADDLYGGFASKQGCFGCLPKVLHDAKPAEQATLDTPFLIFTRGLSTDSPQAMPAVSLAVCNLSLHFNDSDVFSRYLYL